MKMVRLLLHRGAVDKRIGTGGNAESLAEDYWSSPAGGARYSEVVALLADVRRAGGWRKYVRYPRYRLLMLRILAERGRAKTKDALFVRLFPIAPPDPDAAFASAVAVPGANETLKRALEVALANAGIQNVDAEALAGDQAAALALAPNRRDGTPTRAPKRAANPSKTALPMDVFWLIISFWRSSRDYSP